eukprot:5424856-Pyramimonas_sp.AAC.1
MPSMLIISSPISRLCSSKTNKQQKQHQQQQHPEPPPRRARLVESISQENTWRSTPALPGLFLLSHHQPRQVRQPISPLRRPGSQPNFKRVKHNHIRRSECSVTR